MAKEFDRDISIRGIQYRITGTYSEKWVDDSFSHEFGVHHCGHNEIQDVEIECVTVVDQDGGEAEIYPDSFLKAEIIEELSGVLVG